jgi:hypothetical protein
VSNLPTTGGPVYVRLWWNTSSGWQYADYTYTATRSGSGCGAASPTPGMVQPPPGSTLSGSSVTFCWTSGSAVSQYWLYVGTSGVGSNNLYSQSTGTATQATVSNLPTTGGPVYVRLWWNTSSGWQYTDYTYTAA